MSGLCLFPATRNPSPPGASRVFCPAAPAVGQICENRRNASRLSVFSLSTSGLTVPKKQDETQIAELERLNAQLSSSLKRCRQILADCHSRLASNTNAPDEPDEEEAEGSG